MFRDRQDAARQLAERLERRTLERPLVLGIPRGGVVLGAILARAIDAELDIVLSRKLRAPWQPELALGAVSEDGQVYLDPGVRQVSGATDEYLEQERRAQLEEIGRRRDLVRAVRPRAPVDGRTVIVTDDGIATGSTMIAALKVIQSQAPYEVLVAVPVAPPDRLDVLREQCDDMICLLTPAHFWAIGQFYEDFAQVDDARVIEILRERSESPEPAG